jgi:Flp pilus assembly protein TadD
MLLAAAYQQLGRAGDARAAMAAALELRPGSTARNVPPPTKNNSAIFLKASERVVSLMVAAGLPE